MRLVALLAALAVAGVAAAVSVARPSATALEATVGPGYSITLTKDGTKVTNLPPGDYTITVDDKATEHSFHLVGGGVNRATTIEGTGTETWDVTLTQDTYFYYCDAHAATMLGKFTVGDIPPTTTTKPPALKVRASAKAAGRVVIVRATATRAASFDLSLMRAGKRVAHAAAKGKTATVRLKARAAGRYVAKVVAKAGGSAATANAPVTVR